jgi:hypothetical protein
MYIDFAFLESVDFNQSIHYVPFDSESGEDGLTGLKRVASVSNLQTRRQGQATRDDTICRRGSAGLFLKRPLLALPQGAGFGKYFA